MTGWLDLFREYVGSITDNPDITIPHAVVLVVRSFFQALWEMITLEALGLFNSIYETILYWIEQTHSKFAYIGQRIVLSLDHKSSLSFFTDNFVFWFIGIIVFVFVMKILLSLMKELVNFIGGLL